MYSFFIITLVSSTIGLVIFFWVHMKDRVTALYPEPIPEKAWYSIDLVSLLESGIDLVKNSLFNLFIFLLKQAILVYRFSLINLRRYLRARIYRILSTADTSKMKGEESQFLKTVKEYKKQVQKER
ncbi:MAG: hypothetical protein K9M36_01620 [Candidatus Pacebacteria bacterium]|nr:hypothetical protein [Candidatus Paceibacterota bacterium]